jgi:hypothetical protein
MWADGWGQTCLGRLMKRPIFFTRKSKPRAWRVTQISMLATLKRYTPSSTCGVRASSRHGSPRIVAPCAIADQGDIAAWVSAIVSLICIFAVSTRLGAGGYALVFLCSLMARLPIASELSAGIENSDLRVV